MDSDGGVTPRLEGGAHVSDASTAQTPSAMAPPKEKRASCSVDACREVSSYCCRRSPGIVRGGRWRDPLGGLVQGGPETKSTADPAGAPTATLGTLDGTTTTRSGARPTFSAASPESS